MLTFYSYKFLIENDNKACVSSIKNVLREKEEFEVYNIHDLSNPILLCNIALEPKHKFSDVSTGVIQIR